MRKLLGTALTGSMILACGTTGTVNPSTSTSEPGPSVTSTTAGMVTSTSTPTTIAAPTTTIDSPAPESVLVANGDGLFELSGDTVTRLVEGPVQIGVSDLHGGVLFQRDWSPGEIFWIPAAGAEPQKVVEPGEEHSIRLHDVGFGPDGPVIWYTRSSGSEIDDTIEVLYTMALSTGEELEMGVVGGWEASSTVSVGSDLVVREWSAEAYHGFASHDSDFEEIESSWNPYIGSDGEPDCGPCAHSVDLAPDGERVAWLEGREADGYFVQTLVVLDAASGDEIDAVSLPDGLLGIVAGLDLGMSAVLINHGLEDGSFHPALKVDTDDGLILELGIAGNARWASGG